MEPISKLVNIMMEGGDIDSTVEDLLKEVKKAEKFPERTYQAGRCLVRDLGREEQGCSHRGPPAVQAVL